MKKTFTVLILALFAIAYVFAVNVRTAGRVLHAADCPDGGGSDTPDGDGGGSGGDSGPDGGGSDSPDGDGGGSGGDSGPDGTGGGDF